MSQRQPLKHRIDKYFYEHKKVKSTVDYIYAVIMLSLSAFVFAFGFRAFVSPMGNGDTDYLILVTGGMSGVSQIFVKVTQFILGRKLGDDEINTFTSIYYFILNIPIIIIAFKRIGKRFALYTVLNVALSSILMKVIPNSFFDIFNSIIHDNLTRALFAGICTGLSSSFALWVDGSAGGLDVISYAIALKKGTSVAKYVLLFNGIVISIFTFLSYLPVNAESSYNPEAWIILIYAVVYLFVVSLVVEQLSKRNKKAQIQIITTKEEMSKVLLSNFKHGCTVVDAKGAFSGEGKKIVYMVVSLYEVKSVIEVIREYDPHAFVNVVSVQALYGKFHIEPIK